MSKTKVCMITTHHSLLDGRIFYKEARTLQQAGYEVFLLGPLTNDGYIVDMGGNKIAKKKTIIQDIKIFGFNNPRSSITTLLKKLLNLIIFPKLEGVIEIYGDLIKKGVELNADMYHCHEVWSLFVCIQIKKRLQRKGKKIKLVYDVHEFTPAASSRFFENKYLNRMLRRIYARFEKKALVYTDCVVTANQITRGYLLTLNRFIPTQVILNCQSLSPFNNIKNNIKYDNKIIICHEGALVFNRGLKDMIKTMKILRDEYDKEIQLLIVGDVFGEERKYLNKKINEYSLHNNIKITGWLRYESVGSAISQADIGIILMEPTENNMLAGPPNKLFNYMRYGIPVVSFDLPETTRIIEETHCGLIVKDRNVNTLVKNLRYLIEDKEKRSKLGQNGYRAVVERYNWDKEGKKLIQLYREIEEKHVGKKC